MHSATLKNRGKMKGVAVGSVKEALQDSNPDRPKSEVYSAARIVAMFSQVVAKLPKTALDEALAQPKERIFEAFEEAINALDAQPDQPDTDCFEGTGIGETVSLKEGINRLNRFAKQLPLEEWAGPAAGASELEDMFGIRRSTLNNWHKNGVVVGFLRDRRNRSYPLAQFVDGVPIDGIDQIVELAPDQKSAWIWLNQRYDEDSEHTPLTLLREGELEQALELASHDFDRSL